MRLSRIYYLLLVVIGSLALASCDDDDKVVDEGLKVLSAETSFDANGGEHEISVNKDVVKAYAADDWLAVNAQGSKVTISTQANVSNESRHTTLVVKSSETDSTIVNVSQLGSIFVLEGLPSGIAASDAAVSYTYSMKHNLPVEVSSSADWIKVSVTDDSFKVDLKKNETGRFRSGSFTYSSGNIKNIINVSQSEFARDFEGMYYLAYTSNEGTQVAISAKFVKDAEGNYALDLPQLGLSVPVAFDESTFKLSIYAGHNLGVFQKYNTVSILGDSEAGYLVWNSAVSFTAGFQYSDEEGTYAEFEDNGSWPGYNVDYLAIGAYDGDELTNDSYLGNFLTMLNPYLLKIDASGARKKMNVATPKLSIMK